MEMNRRRIEIVFFGIICLTSLILSQTIIIYKTEYIGFLGLDQNIAFFTSVFLIGLAFPIFNHLVLEITIFKNAVYSVIGVFLAYIFAKIIFGIVIGIFVRYDDGKTPLGWEFQYMWSVIRIMTGLLIMLTEFYGKKLKKPTHNQPNSSAQN